MRIATWNVNSVKQRQEHLERTQLRHPDAEPGGGGQPRMIGPPMEKLASQFLMISVGASRFGPMASSVHSDTAEPTVMKPAEVL